MMKEKIIELLNEIAKEYNIKILFSVESGSRAWGMESNDSDYDIRFVFYRKPEEYTLINPKSEVITASFNEKFERCSPEECLIDMQGFDILKFTKMLSSSNPSVIEWLNSEILYSGERPKEFIKFSKKQFNFKSLYYHYKSMGRQNYLKYIKPQNGLSTPKKYLYTCRGILSAIYVKEYLELPPIKFPSCLGKLSKDDKIPFDIFTTLSEIIEDKKKQKERFRMRNCFILDKFIEEQLIIDESPINRKFFNPEQLNKIIIPIIHNSLKIV